MLLIEGGRGILVAPIYDRICQQTCGDKNLGGGFLYHVDYSTNTNLPLVFSHLNYDLTALAKSTNYTKLSSNSNTDTKLKGLGNSVASLNSFYCFILILIGFRTIQYTCNCS